MSPLVTTSSITLRSILFYVLALSTIAAVVLYVLFQARFILEGPQIDIASTSENPTSNRMVIIEGTAQNIVRMTLNGRQIFTDKYGNFKEALVLENGYTIATLQAEDRYGRSSTQMREFVYKSEDIVSITKDNQSQHGI